LHGCHLVILLEKAVKALYVVVPDNLGDILDFPAGPEKLKIQAKWMDKI
jgi:hypothetical protein